MDTARTSLLQRVVEDVAAHGIGDRSLRDIAASVGTSHRMLLYHFGSRAGLVAAVVEQVEADQRATFRSLAATITDPAELIRSLWQTLVTPELRPFIRLFFEVVVASEHTVTDLTGPWLAESDDLARLLGAEIDPVEMRLGIAVTRGLLIDVLTTGDVDAATAALERYIALSTGAAAPPA
jgi:AcrR family transcriptional regulator